MKREKRHQAAGPEGGFFEAFSFFLDGAQIQQGSTGCGPVEPCAAPAGATRPSVRAGLSAPRTGGCFLFFFSAGLLLGQDAQHAA